MPKNKVNNNIKLKSGGGVINDATDGLSVDTGTTANKLVRLDGNAKLPAVDGSQLTNLGEIVPGDTVRASAPTERSQNCASGSYSCGYIAKSFTWNDIDGTINISLEMKNDSSEATSYVGLFINDVLVAQVSQKGDSYTAKTFSNVSVSNGDTIKFKTHGGGLGGNTTIKNVVLKYNKILITTDSTVVED